jgi:hypothetical protein
MTCPECGVPARSVQGLAGHRRLAHSTETRQALGLREEQVAKREQGVRERERTLAGKERDVVRREREIAETGPAALGMKACSECGSWFESEANLARHGRTIHPVENAVAGETRTSPERVTSVWVEACRKQRRHPNKTPEQIIQRFWGTKDREILERLLARGGVFRFREED